MTDKEIEFKTKMWMRINATYLKVRIWGFIYKHAIPNPDSKSNTLYGYKL